MLSGAAETEEKGICMKTEIKDILEEVKNGTMSVEDALMKLKTAPYEDLGFAKIDTHRGVRQGVSEVIYGAGKTPEQITKIATRMKEGGQEHILITRLTPEKAAELPADLFVHYFKEARIGIIGDMRIPDGIGTVVVATGGTSDIPVAEEAALTAEFLGNQVIRLYDVGVAGLHRLLSHLEEIMGASVIIAIAGMEGALASVIGGLAEYVTEEYSLGNKVTRVYDVGVSGLHRLLSHKEELMSASVIIAVAGMEGALASVIGGLVDCPVIAVPTSVGYGAAFDGLSALLSMLNSCASGVSVVNIDNGFGAGYLAGMINHMEVKK